MTAAALLTIAGNAQTTPTSNIGKSDIKVESGLMTPEALWAMGRIATATASPDGKQIVYQVGYYSVKENKGHQVLCIVDANGKNNRQLTTAATSETDPAWIEQGQRIAYLSGGEVWAMKADGTGREQLSNSGGSIEAFKFSPDGKKRNPHKINSIQRHHKEEPRRPAAGNRPPCHRPHVPPLGPLRRKHTAPVRGRRD